MASNILSRAMSAKRLLLCMLIAELPGWVIPISRWEEEPLESNFLLDREESMESRFFNGKQPEHRERFLEQVKRVARPDDASLQQALMSSSCSCETDYYLREFAEGNYPRYLTAARCMEKPCQNKFNACRLLHYTVYVLQQRDTSQLSVKRRSSPEVALPESLRRKWQLAPQSIGVACVPSMDGRRD